MKASMPISLVVVAALVTSGCMVSKSQYTEAVQDADVAKADLERALAQKTAFEQQVKTLKELNSKLTQEAQLVKDELQRIEHGRDTERGSLVERNARLEKQLRMLAAQHRQLRKQHRDLTRRNKALASTVVRYQKELKERQPADAQVTSPGRSIPSTARAKPATPSTASKTRSGAQPPAATPVSRSAAGAALVNMNSASASDMMLLLNLSKDDANRVITNRPYRIKGELVAKNVLPKNTFDRIKGRITVTR